MRWMCTHAIHELAKIDKRVVFVGSDFGPGGWDEFPERCLMEGISEQNLTGIAAGLAMEGKIPFVYSIAPFVTRRNFEQIALDACGQNLPIRIAGSGAGLAYAHLGFTHMAIDDIAIMRVLPNMTVIVSADKNEIQKAIMSTANHPGPIYFRVGKGFEPVVTDERPFEIGKAYPYREGNHALVITTGITLRLAKEAAEELEKKGVNISILHVPTIKPFPIETVLDYSSRVPLVITIEEHQITGGLGSATAEALAESAPVGTSHPRLHRIGIRDVFPHEYGTQDSCLAAHGITSAAIVDCVNQSGRNSGTSQVATPQSSEVVIPAQVNVTSSVG